jgi:hypothetical protein
MFGDARHERRMELVHGDLYAPLCIFLHVVIYFLFVFENNRSTGVG